MRIIDLLVRHQVVSPFSQARRAVMAGGVRVNGAPEYDIDATVTADDVVVYGVRREVLDVPPEAA